VRIFSAPPRNKILEELACWAAATRERFPEIAKVGLFGSYAKNNYTPGSDLDLLLIVEYSQESRWFMRSAHYQAIQLSLPADLFVYTQAEAERMEKNNPWFQSVLRDILWLF
jgi:predicted nucleotidyltransferase